MPDLGEEEPCSVILLWKRIHLIHQEKDQHSCQIIHARQSGEMLFAQHRLPQPECLS